MATFGVHAPDPIQKVTAMHSCAHASVLRVPGCGQLSSGMRDAMHQRGLRPSSSHAQRHFPATPCTLNVHLLLLLAPSSLSPSFLLASHLTFPAPFSLMH